MKKIVNTIPFPATVERLFATNVVVKAALFLTADEVEELVLRLYMVHNYDFMKSVPMCYGKPITCGTNFIEIRATGCGAVCVQRNGFTKPWLGQDMERIETPITGMFIDVLREDDHFVRGERVSNKTINTAIAHLQSANAILSANGRPQSIAGMREIVRNFDSLPKKWQNAIKKVLSR